MEGTMKKDRMENLEKMLYLRTHNVERGGKPMEAVQDSVYLNQVAKTLIEVYREQEELNKRKSFPFPKFGKDVVKKPDHNLLILGALVLAGFALGIVFRVQIIKANVE